MEFKEQVNWLAGFAFMCVHSHGAFAGSLAIFPKTHSLMAEAGWVRCQGQPAL